MESIFKGLFKNAPKLDAVQVLKAKQAQDEEVAKAKGDTKAPEGKEADAKHIVKKSADLFKGIL